MNVIRRISILFLFVSALCAKAETPLYFGPPAAAQRVKSGDCRWLDVGDSILSTISDGMVQAIYRSYRPDKWVGIGSVFGADSGDTGLTSNSSAYSQTFATSTVSDAANGNTNVTGVGTAWAITNGVSTLFNGGAVPSDPNAFGNRVAEASFFESSENFLNRRWGDGKPITCRYIGLINPNGCLSYRVRVRTIGGGSTVAETTGLSASGTLAVTTVDVTVPSASNQSSVGPTITIQPTASTTPASGKNLIHLGYRFFTGESGFEYHYIAHSGYSTASYLDTTKMSDALLTQYIQAVNPTDIKINLGQNDAGTRDKAAFKANIKLDIARFRLGAPTAHLWLRAPYQTDPASWTQTSGSAGQYADAIYEAAKEDGNASFLNLWLATGGDNFTYSDSRILSDHVHPTATGNIVIANIEWGMIEALAKRPPLHVGAGVGG